MIARYQAGVKSPRKQKSCTLYYMVFLCDGCLREMLELGLRVLARRNVPPMHECNRCNGVKILGEA